MRSTFIVIITAFCFLSSTSEAQTGSNHFTYRIDSLPMIYSWDYLTDPNETGKLTENKGSRPISYSNSATVIFDKIQKYVTDTSIYLYQYTDSNYSVSIIFDSKNHWKSFTFEMLLGQYSDISYNFTLKLEDLTPIETDSTFEVLVKGAQLLVHHFNVRWSEHNYDVPSSQSWDDVDQSTDSVNSLSLIALSISKSSFTKLDVRNIIEEQTKACHPNPASKTIFFNRSIEGDNIDTYSVLGKKYILPVIHVSGNDRCEVSSLPPGVYYLNIGASPEKILISH